MIEAFKNLFAQVRGAIGLEEILFLLGMAFLYCGLAVQFSHAAAQIISGAVLVVLSFWMAAKGNS